MDNVQDQISKFSIKMEIMLEIKYTVTEMNNVFHRLIKRELIPPRRESVNLRTHP